MTRSLSNRRHEREHTRTRLAFLVFAFAAAVAIAVVLLICFQRSLRLSDAQVREFIGVAVLVMFTFRAIVNFYFPRRR